MRTNISKLLATALLFIFLPLNLNLLAPNFAEAATGDTSIIIQPAKIEVKASLGQKLARSFSIINRSNFNVRLRLVVKDYKQISDDGKLEFYTAEKEQASLWLVPQFLEITLKPLSTKDISFVINVPEDFSGGGHYGAILFEPANDESNIAINTEGFGELVLLTVTGNEIKTSAIAKAAHFGTGAIQNGNPVDFSLEIQNTGNTHFVTQGKLVLRNWFGKEAGNFDMGQMIVYPETNRVFKWRWSDTPSFGIFRANLMLSDPSSTDLQKLKLIDSTWFILFPWQAGLIILAAGLVAFALVRYRKNIFTNRLFYPKLIEKVRLIRF